MRASRLIGSFVVFAGALGAVACNEPASPRRAAAPQAVTASLTSITQTLISCPGGEDLVSAVSASPLGGTIHVGPTEVVVPAGAVPALIELTIATPRSDFMRVDINAVGVEHYQFQQPISVTIDYSRCSDDAFHGGPLSVWYVADDGTMLERMPSLDDRANQRVTFLTNHLSGYAIAD